MKDLVILENNQAVTSSRCIADVFDKEHKHVLQSIDSIINGAAEK